jgi:cobaltochelatase CobN
MTMAVRDTTGVSPETYLADVRDADLPRMETLRETLTRDLRGKFWNPKWIRGLQEEGFSGAVEISQTATNLFGWQVTKPEAIDEYVWDAAYEIYAEDSLGLDLPEWFDSENPFAYQNIAAVMLEAVRKGYWDPSADVIEHLAVSYADSVDRHGAAGDIRTVNNQPFASFVEQRLVDAERVKLTSALRRELDFDGREDVVGRRLVEAEALATRSASLTGASLGAVVLLALAGVFLVGWRRA